MHGAVQGPADDADLEVFKNLHDRYDMHAHGRAGGSQTTALTDEFMDDFAILGDAAHCIERLESLMELGIDKFLVSGPNHTARSQAGEAASRQFAEAVLPRFAGTEPGV